MTQHHIEDVPPCRQVRVPCVKTIGPGRHTRVEGVNGVALEPALNSVVLENWQRKARRMQALIDLHAAGRLLSDYAYDIRISVD